MAATEQRGRGRPSTGITPKRYFRMDDDSWAKVVEKASRNGESASEYIRRLILDSLSNKRRKK